MLLVVAGTRPEIIKIAPVIEAFKKKGIQHEFIWTGQHYDYEMYKIFFEQLKIPEPDVYLDIPASSLDESAKLFTMITRIIKIIREKHPIAVYALGDTISTLSAALSSAFTRTPFIHDEAGMRSFNAFMLEEINRRICDHIAIFRFAPTKIALLNLLFEGIRRDTVELVGSTLVDSLLKISPIISKIENKVLEKFAIEKNRYIIITIHRRENLTHDKLKNLIILLKKLNNIFKSEYIKIIFPMHPHTRRKLIIHNYYSILEKMSQLIITKPLGYIEFLSLIKNSKLVITDSGGVQQEAFLLGKRIITLRSSTEWPETVILGYNKIIELNDNIEYIVKVINKAYYLPSLSPPNLKDNPIGDGDASSRIASKIKILLEKLLINNEIIKHNYIFTPDSIYLIPYLDNAKVTKYSSLRVANATICFSENGIPINTAPNDVDSNTLLCSRRIPLTDLQHYVDLNEYIKVKWYEEDKSIINSQ